MMTHEKSIGTTFANRAYILIKTDFRNAGGIAELLQLMPGISMVDIVNGPYQVIAVMEGDDISKIATTVAIDIRKLTGVKDIIVYMSVMGREAMSIDRTIDG